MLGLIGFWEHFDFVLGCVMLCGILPLVGPVVLAAMIWEAGDRGFDGGFVDTGKELTGFLLAKVAPWYNRVTHNFNMQFVKRAEDAYMINCIFFGGVVLPCMFAFCWFHTRNHGFSLALCFTYHLLRIGPYFMNFAYVYTLCHKEGHTFTGLYAKQYNNSIITRNVFNWWIGLFFGVMPASFAFGHSINHHRYNNGPLDCISTSDKPRDSIVNFCAYIPRWTWYSLNITTTIQFLKEGNTKVAQKMVLGSLYFWTWYGAFHFVDPLFAFAYLMFPFWENVLLLAAVNWSWHAFNNPKDPEDEYVGSLTILDGCINVLNEDSHVVHHQYPGAHWTDHPRLTDKHWDAYAEHQATIFRKTHAFEIFGLVVGRQYDKLAEKFVDLKGQRAGKEMTHEQKIAILQERVRACWWGPRKPADLVLQGKEVGNLMDGKAVDGTYGKLSGAHKDVVATKDSKTASSINSASLPASKAEEKKAA